MARIRMMLRLKTLRCCPKVEWDGRSLTRQRGESQEKMKMYWSGESTIWPSCPCRPSHLAAADETEVERDVQQDKKKESDDE